MNKPAICRKLVPTIFAGLFLLIFCYAKGQVAINPDGHAAEPSAMLVVHSVNKGFLLPRVALQSATLADPVVSPVPGLLVYNTAPNGIAPDHVILGYYSWNGARWMPLSLPPGANPGEMAGWNGSSWGFIPAGQYGEKLVFCNGIPVWGGCLPVVLSDTVTNIFPGSATSGGTVTNEGGTTVNARGVCWDTLQHPTVASNHTVDGSGPGTFQSVITGLAQFKTYYTRAYATNTKGTSYGNETSFWSGCTALLPVSISISASANSVCAGTSVTFTAMPVNGGSAPAYQWKVNANNAGNANNAVFNYTPVNGDAITCELTSNAVCAIGNPASSNAVAMTVNPLLPVSIAIAPSANSVCAGTSVTFTATPVNGGSSPVYQWRKNNVNIPGATNTNYSYVPVNNDIIKCDLTSSAMCAIGNPASSNTAAMTVNPLLPVSVSISASANNICAGTLVIFSATPTNGGTNPGYQWKKGGTAISGATLATYSYVPVNGDVITCTLTSNAACATGNPATPNGVTIIVNPLLPVSIAIVPSANSVCAGISVTFTATPTNGGTAPAYQWKKVGVLISGATNPTYSYVPVNGDVITCELTSNALCASGSPATSNAVIMIVNPLLPVSVSISASANNVCAGTTVTFTATPVNGGTAPAYQWKVNGNNADNAGNAGNAVFDYTPVNGDVISCEMTSSALCATGNPATSNLVTMIVNPLLPVSVSISVSANSVCAGTLVTFTATPVNGGTTPAYQWKVNGNNADNAGNAGNANNAVFDYTPVNGDVITCELTSNALCASGSPATSNAVIMIVNPLLPVSVSISASANNVCAGTTVTFTATPVNGGTAPAYQWKVNGNNADNAGNAGNAGNAVFDYTPVNGDVISCEMTSSALCATGNPATSNLVTMIVNPLLPVSVSISVSANSVCAGTLVTFTATPVNGGTTPGYQWKVNGNNADNAGNAVFDYTPVNGDVITCELTSNAICATGNPAISNAVAMSVNPLLPVSVSIAASANSVCAGTSVTFTATPVNGGTTPGFQWKKGGTAISGATLATYSYVPVNGDVITCELTSNAICATGNPAISNAVAMSVNPLLPVSVSISASANSVCAGISVTFTATPVNGGSAPAYQWRKGSTNISGATNATYSYMPVNNDIIKCVLTSSATCKSGSPATSNAITMIVNPLLVVSVTITASANPIIVGIPVIFTATPVNGGSSPVYQWKVNGVNAGSGSSSYSYMPQNGDMVGCVLTSSLTNCISGSPATSNAITMSVFVLTGTYCSGISTVLYEGQTYNTVLIGNQCWLKENLNVGVKINGTLNQANNSTIEKYCSGNSDANCTVYGGLYQWNEAMQYVTTSGTKGICPTGWHIPTDAEWTTLTNMLGGEAVAGGKLKETGTTHWASPNTGATNSTGFKGLPGNYRDEFGGFPTLTFEGYFWSSSYSNPSTYAWIRFLQSNSAEAFRDDMEKINGVSVRCIQNAGF